MEPKSSKSNLYGLPTNLRDGSQFRKSLRPFYNVRVWVIRLWSRCLTFSIVVEHGFESLDDQGKLPCPSGSIATMVLSSISCHTESYGLDLEANQGFTILASVQPASYWVRTRSWSSSWSSSPSLSSSWSSSYSSLLYGVDGEYVEKFGWTLICEKINVSLVRWTLHGRLANESCHRWSKPQALDNKSSCSTWSFGHVFHTHSPLESLRVPKLVVWYFQRGVSMPTTIDFDQIISTKYP